MGSDTKAYESYNAIYADSRKWALENWVDYIAPQVYTEIGNSAADYKTVVDWWSDTLKNSKTKLYIDVYKRQEKKQMLRVEPLLTERIIQMMQGIDQE